MAENWAEDTRTIDFQLGVEFELNQTPGKLYPLVGQSGTHSDKSSEITDRFDDDANLEEKVNRNEDTNYTDPSTERRWIKKPKTADGATLLDRDDAKATRLDLQSPNAVRWANAVRRYHDDQWLTGYFGTAWTGETGDVAVPFDSNNVLAHGSAGITKNKLLEMSELMLDNDCDLELEMPIMLIDQKGRTDLLKIEEYVNADYNESKPLVRGEIKPWLGFRFFMVNLTSVRAYPKGSSLVVPGEDQMSYPCFLPSGLYRGVWTEFFGSVDRLPGKKHSTQVYAEACSAVTRLNEAKCYQFRVYHG